MIQDGNSLSNITLTIDGKEVPVTNVEFTYEYDNDYTTVSLEGCMYPYMEDEVTTAEQTFTLKKCEPVLNLLECDTADESQVILPQYEKKNITIHDLRNAVAVNKERAVKEEAACQDSRGYYDPYEVVRKVKDLDLTEDQRLLRKYGLVNNIGNVTNAGKELLLELVFEDWSDEIVEKLRELEEAKKADKE